MNTLFTYVPSEVNCIVGSIPVSGFETGTFIEINKVEDSWSAKSGIGGDAIRILKVDKLYTVTLTLHYGSASNDYLSGLATADVLVPGSGLVPISIDDGLGRTTFVSSEAWVQTTATTGFSDAADPRKWVIQVYNPEYVVAGS